MMSMSNTRPPSSALQIPKAKKPKALSSLLLKSSHPSRRTKHIRLSSLVDVHVDEKLMRRFVQDRHLLQRLGKVKLFRFFASEGTILWHIIVNKFWSRISLKSIEMCRSMQCSSWFLMKKGPCCFLRLESTMYIPKKNERSTTSMYWIPHFIAQNHQDPALQDLFSPVAPTLPLMTFQTFPQEEKEIVISN